MTSFTNAAAAVTLALILSGLCSGQAPPRRSAKTAPKATQQTGPKVTRVDIEDLKALLKPNGKPRLINFWATWCDPCREEFPDLVLLDNEYRGKVDLLTVSLDDLAEIDRDVPKFLGEMKAKMPAYLLRTPDEAEALSAIFKDWKGNLPLTVLFDKDGNLSYQRNGKIRLDVVRENINKLLPSPQPK